MKCVVEVKAVSLKTYIFIVLVLLPMVPSASSLKHEFIVQTNNQVAKLNHFWASTGFCPPLPHQKSSEYFLSESELQNLILIGSVPQGGIQQVRIHWLLDLVKLSKGSTTGKTILDFSLLDQLIDRIWTSGLRPGFELMGNPSNWFTDLEDVKQVYAWRDMITALAKHYIGRYGLDYVSKWNFESWNEPDHKDFDRLNFTVQGFLNYYDACSEGLRAVSPKLRFGGPAGACRDNKFSVICWGLLQHCDNGTNYFTEETGVRIDFISFHHKGKGHSMYILDTEIATIQQIRRLYPRLANVPIFNDEADPLVGWSKPEEWRADATYAAVVVKVIAQHQNLLISQQPDFNYALLSNDNGFLDFNPHFFRQRTLVARFQMNETHPPSVQTVKKPVLSVMGLLALLGETQVQVLPDSGREDMNNNSDVGIIASVHLPSNTSGAQDSWQTSIIVYNSNDTSNLTGTDNVIVTVGQVPTGSTHKDMKYVVYVVNNTHGNPYGVWTRFNKPVYPSQRQFSEMREQQEPVRIKGPITFTAPEVTFDFNLSKPGVMLFHICAKPSATPPQVKNLRLHSVTPYDVLLSWDDVSSRCLLTYQLEFAVTQQGNYLPINDVDIIFTSFLYSIDSKNNATLSISTNGWYRVRAIDFWNQSGAYSRPVQLK